MKIVNFFRTLFSVFLISQICQAADSTIVYQCIAQDNQNKLISPDPGQDGTLTLVGSRNSGQISFGSKIAINATFRPDLEPDPVFEWVLEDMDGNMVNAVVIHTEAPKEFVVFAPASDGSVIDCKKTSQ